MIKTLPKGRVFQPVKKAANRQNANLFGDKSFDFCYAIAEIRSILPDKDRIYEFLLQALRLHSDSATARK